MTSRLLSVLLWAALAVSVVSTPDPGIASTANCPVSSSAILGSNTLCCGAGYALTALGGSNACQPFKCCGGGSCATGNINCPSANGYCCVGLQGCVDHSGCPSCCYPNGAPGSSVTFLPSPANVANDPLVCGILGDLYYGLAGNGWTFSQRAGSLNGVGWAKAAAATATDYCTFPGLTCDTNGSLAIINLMEASGGAWGCSAGAYNWDFQLSNMLGTVPASTGLLGTSITDISINGLGGLNSLSWMNTLGKLSSLTCIEFHSQNFQGALPTSLPPNLNKLSIYASGPMNTDMAPPSPALLGLLLNPNANPFIDVSKLLSPNYTALAFILPSQTSLRVTGAYPIRDLVAFNAGNLPNMSALMALTSLVINTQSTNLYGSIPDMFAGMIALASLDLSNNALTGALPPSAIRLCSKQGVACSFGGNSLTMTPTQFLAAQPTTATGFSFSSWGASFLSGSMPSLSAYTALTALQLGGQSLTGTIPDMFGGMTALTTLDLSNNALSGTLPASAFALCLESGVSCNFGGGSNAVVLNTSALASLPASTQTISLDGVPWGVSSVTGVLPNLATLTALTSLVIRNQGSTLAGTIPDVFGGMTALANLDLSNNALSGTLPASAVVQCFRSGSCSFGGGSNAVALNTSALASLPASTQTISLDGVPWGVSSVTGVLPNLATLTALTSLVIRNQGSTLAGTIPDMFGGMTLLTNLDLRSNSLTGSLPQSLIRLCLKPGVTCYLGGSNNFLTSNILPALPLNITSFAGFWGITLAAMPDLSSFTSLTSINLYSAGLTGTIPSWFSRLTALQSLELSSNALSGTIPDIFWSTSALSYLHLTSNSFAGNLPPSLGYLGIAVVQIDNNPGLNGSIPLNLLNGCSLATAYFSPNGPACQFSSTALTVPASFSSIGGSSFDPTSLLASIASLTTTVNSLQVNLTNAQAACSASG